MQKCQFSQGVLVISSILVLRRPMVGWGVRGGGWLASGKKRDASPSEKKKAFLLSGEERREREEGRRDSGFVVRESRRIESKDGSSCRALQREYLRYWCLFCRVKKKKSMEKKKINGDFLMHFLVLLKF